MVFFLWSWWILILRDDDNILAFLSKYDKYNSLYIPWVCYGTSFHINQPKGLVIEIFTYYSPNYHEQGKSISKLNALKKIGCVHKIVENIDDPINYVFDKNTPLHELPIQINHYVKNSLKTFLKRKFFSALNLNIYAVIKYT